MVLRRPEKRGTTKGGLLYLRTCWTHRGTPAGEWMVGPTRDGGIVHADARRGRLFWRAAREELRRSAGSAVAHNGGALRCPPKPRPSVSRTDGHASRRFPDALACGSCDSITPEVSPVPMQPGIWAAWALRTFGPYAGYANQLLRSRMSVAIIEHLQRRRASSQPRGDRSLRRRSRIDCRPSRPSLLCDGQVRDTCSRRRDGRARAPDETRPR